MKLGDKSSADIGVDLDAKEKEYQEAIKHLATVEQEILLLRKEEMASKEKRMDLEVARSKASQNLRVMASELRVLKNAFFAAQRQGL